MRADSLVTGGGDSIINKYKLRKTWKSRSEEKVLGFSSTSLFLPGKWEASPSGIDHPTRRKPREPVLSKAGRTSRTAGAFQIH